MFQCPHCLSQKLSVCLDLKLSFLALYHQHLPHTRCFLWPYSCKCQPFSLYEGFLAIFKTHSSPSFHSFTHGPSFPAHPTFLSVPLNCLICTDLHGKEEKVGKMYVALFVHQTLKYQTLSTKILIHSVI